MDAIECEARKLRLAVMLIGGREVALIFADVRLPASWTAFDLAREGEDALAASSRDPHVGTSARAVGELPPGVRLLPKTVAAAQRA